jgi:hypothetical protein
LKKEEDLPDDRQVQRTIVRFLLDSTQGTVEEKAFLQQYYDQHFDAL